MAKYMHAREAAKRLGITIERLYKLAHKDRIVGAMPASEAFRKANKPERGAEPSLMFAAKGLAIKEAPVGHRPRSYPIDESTRTSVRSTKIEELRWKIAAAKCSERMKLPSSSALSIGPWSRRTLNEGADKLGVPTDAAIVEQLAAELGLE